MTSTSPTCCRPACSAASSPGVDWRPRCCPARWRTPAPSRRCWCPWNTCGAYISGVLGVSTAAYFPFCFFNLLSPRARRPLRVPRLQGPQGRRPRGRRRPGRGPHTETGDATGQENLDERPGHRRPRPSSKRAVHAAVGVHDPVRPHRPDGARHLAHPGRRLRARQGGAPIPGTYPRSTATRSGSSIDSLTAPINGLYGIEDADGNINYYNTGVLFGAIDVALFIIVIGGFLGVTMRTGAIQAGIGRLVARLHGRERWMIPILMTVFALGGSTYGMAEESLAFYTLVITVMIAAGYDALTGAAVVLLGLRHRHPRARRSTRSRPASPPGSPASRSATGSLVAAGHPRRRPRRSGSSS